ncbi:MAG TPA: hypothetical protein VF773_02260 [Verrucomicrobiae bacterium]
MKTEQQIEQQGGVKKSVFTVLNWSQYQKAEQQNEQQSSSNRAAIEQQNSVSPNKHRASRSRRMKEGKECEEEEGQPLHSQNLNLMLEAPNLRESTAPAFLSGDDLSDDEWLQRLEGNPAYEGIDVRKEFGKMQAWASVNRKRPSRKRFINWLNNADRPMKVTTPATPFLSHNQF